MKKFFIGDLAHFSGIKAPTLRIWEQRYQIIKPQRGEGNFRYYNLQEVEHLLQISLLNRYGYKISRLARMDNSSITESIFTLKFEESKQSLQVNRLILHLFSGQTEEFETILDSCMLYWGIDITIKNVIIPFLEKTQLFSCKDCDSETDFAIAAIRKKMIMGIEKANPGFYKNQKALLFLPKGEYFDLLLLYFNYKMKCSGIKVLYMGTNISSQKLKKVNLAKKPDFLLTYISPKNQAGITDMKEYLNEKSALTCFVAVFDSSIRKKIHDSRLRFIHFNESADVISENYSTAS